jgi:DNA-binding Lrp family transcriptional regulator
MTKPSLISRIERFARGNPRWISGGEYERLAMSVGYKASNCSRRLRELENAGVLERKEMNGHVWYRARQHLTFQEGRELSIKIAERHEEKMTEYLQENSPSPEVARVGQQSFI